MREFSDAELLKILEENGKVPSSKNLSLLKEIINENLETEEKEVPEDNTDNNIADLFDSEEVVIEEKPKKEIVNAYDKDLINKKKALGIKDMKARHETEVIVKEFLINSCGMREDEFLELSEDVEQQTIASVINNLFVNLQNKLTTIDTSVADRSRGDISSLRELDSIQEAITQIETMIERSNRFLPEGNEIVSTIIKSMVYLNQYSNVFRDAYRNKKTLLILKYQSIILSIISSVSYLISALIDFKAEAPEIRDVVRLEKIAPIRTLENFVNSVNNGEFKTITRDIGVLREYYMELPVETMSKLVEATDTVSMVIDGVRNFISSLEQDNRISNLLYKLTGTVILLFSLRDTFYALFRMKTKVADMLQGISSFANMNAGGQLNKLLQFANKFKMDAESASTMSQREIEDDNKKINLDVKALQAAPLLPAPKAEEKPVEDKPDPNDISQFSFGF